MGESSDMREDEVQRRFVDYLQSEGWIVSTENPKHIDVIATKDGEPRLVAEVKGDTSTPGMAVDTLYGQILNRMDDLSGQTRYAIVVPESILRFVDRVSLQVRDLLKIETWVVPEHGSPCRVHPE